jgi:hypothetical protein
MGTTCASLLFDLSLYSYEVKFIQEFSPEKEKEDHLISHPAI